MIILVEPIEHEGFIMAIQENRDMSDATEGGGYHLVSARFDYHATFDMNWWGPPEMCIYDRISEWRIN